jgi:multicomponent Na+:H+ antiporter subunit E
MGFYAVLAIPVALFWMLVTSRISLESFVLGYVFGLAALLLLRPQRTAIRWQQLPGQILALIMYTLVLMRDITLSGIDVARRVLSPSMPLNPGIIAVETQDEKQSPLIAALSADVITLTPGELVVEVEGNRILYVHCLDVEASAMNAPRQQAQRLKLFKRILGRES